MSSCGLTLPGTGSSSSFSGADGDTSLSTGLPLTVGRGTGWTQKPWRGVLSPSGGRSAVKQLWVVDAQLLSCLHRNFCHSTIEPTTVFMYSWGSVKNKQINKNHTRLKQNKTKQNNPQIERSKPLIDLVTAVPDKKLLSPQPPAPHGTWRPCIVSHLLLCCWWRCQRVSGLGSKAWRGSQVWRGEAGQHRVWDRNHQASTLLIHAEKHLASWVSPYCTWAFRNTNSRCCDKKLIMFKLDRLLYGCIEQYWTVLNSNEQYLTIMQQVPCACPSSLCPDSIVLSWTTWIAMKMTAKYFGLFSLLSYLPHWEHLQLPIWWLWSHRTPSGS